MDSLRYIWNQMSAVRLLLPFIVGICICIAADNLPLFFFALLLLSVGTIIYINLLRSTPSVYKWRYMSGFAVSLVMLSLGYVVTYYNTERLNPHHVTEVKSGDAIYSGTVIEP